MPVENIAANLERVRDNISRACKRAGRSEDEVCLIAVTKTVGNEEVAELARLGVRDFGENRVQVGLTKTDFFCNENYNWHFIGHLQRNKASEALEGFRCVHSLESLKLAKVLSTEAQKQGIGKVKVFLEVNISGEESKYGLTADNARAFLESVLAYDNLEVCGLMTMAPFYDEPEDTRPVFAGLRELRDRLGAECGVALDCLSMGMSNDYEVAVEEGATHVRVGTALYR